MKVYVTYILLSRGYCGGTTDEVETDLSLEEFSVNYVLDEITDPEDFGDISREDQLNQIRQDVEKGSFADDDNKPSVFIGLDEYMFMFVTKQESRMDTIKDLKKLIESFDDETPLRVSSYMEQGRGGSWDSDSDWNIFLEDGQVVLRVTGDESSESGGYDQKLVVDFITRMCYNVYTIKREVVVMLDIILECLRAMGEGLEHSGDTYMNTRTHS